MHVTLRLLSASVSLFPERALMPNKSVERADYHPPRRRLGPFHVCIHVDDGSADPQLTPAAIDDFTFETGAVPRRFVFLGGRGMVHKGLTCRSAFAEMPDCHLTICGDVAREPHFQVAYQRELVATERENVRLHRYAVRTVPICLCAIDRDDHSLRPKPGLQRDAGMMVGLIPVDIEYRRRCDRHRFSLTN
jgi:hypothetical protein